MDWQKLCTPSDIPQNQLKEFEVAGESVVIANVSGKFYAFSALCPHAQCPLANGILQNFALTCSCHGAKFDVRTGQVLALPATQNLKTYTLKIDNKHIFIKL